MEVPRSPGESKRAILIYIAASVLAATLVHRYYTLGGPYFEFPRTVQDHVAPELYPSRDMILLARAAADIIPRAATVTAIQPSQAPDYDVTLYLTAAGMMPRHRVVPPSFGDHGLAATSPSFVLAVRDPFSHPRYHLFRQLPEGRIYEVNR